MTQTFEEQFPELSKHIVDGDSKEMDNIDLFSEYVPTERVSEFCLDKQKVRDALISLRGYDYRVSIRLMQIQKEFGL
jgi:hypothetical protein